MKKLLSFLLIISILTFTAVSSHGATTLTVPEFEVSGD